MWIDLERLFLEGKMCCAMIGKGGETEQVELQSHRSGGSFQEVYTILFWVAKYQWNTLFFALYMKYESIRIVVCDASSR